MNQLLRQERDLVTLMKQKLRDMGPHDGETYEQIQKTEQGSLLVINCQGKESRWVLIHTLPARTGLNHTEPEYPRRPSLLLFSYFVTGVLA